MRIKDSPKSNAEGGGKKETKKKSARQKAESNSSVTVAKNDRKSHNTTATSKADKHDAENPINKNEQKRQV